MSFQHTLFEILAVYVWFPGFFAAVLAKKLQNKQLGTNSSLQTRCIIRSSLMVMHVNLDLLIHADGTRGMAIVISCVRDYVLSVCLSAF